MVDLYDWFVNAGLHEVEEMAVLRARETLPSIPYAV